MTPYYQDALVTLYHADARDVVPTLADIDLLLPDPPYGLNAAYGRSELGHRRIVGDGDTELLRWLSTEAARLLLDDRWAVLFCGYSAVGQVQEALVGRGLTVKTVIVWDKEMPGLGNGIRNQYELAVLGRKGMPPEPWEGGNVWRLSRIRGERPIHPHEKPVPLLARFVVRYSAPGQLVLDPFAGSGTTLMAAKVAGRRAVGIEIEEEWCEATANRLAGIRVMGTARQDPLGLPA